MNHSNTPPVTTDPTAGTTISVVGDTYRILINGDETNNEFATIDMLIPPGGGPGPHAHADMQETFFVVDGEVEVKSEAGTYTARKGAYVVIPKGGIVHGFKNKGDRPAHLLCTVVPAGLENFFLEIGRPVPLGEFLPAPQMDAEAAKKLQAAAEKYGQKVFPPDYLD